MQSLLLLTFGGLCFYLILQLCKIVEGQRYTKPLSSKQRQFQIAACKQGPQERQGICENAMNVSKYSSDKLIAEFGLQFQNRLADVTGRILPAPQVWDNTLSESTFMFLESTAYWLENCTPDISLV